MSEAILSQHDQDFAHAMQLKFRLNREQRNSQTSEMSAEDNEQSEQTLGDSLRSSIIQSAMQRHLRPYRTDSAGDDGRAGRLEANEQTRSRYEAAGLRIPNIEIKTAVLSAVAATTGSPASLRASNTPFYLKIILKDLCLPQLQK